MSAFLLIWTFLFLFASEITARDLTDRENNGLVGPVKTVMTKDDTFTTTDTYDSGGRLIQSVRGMFDNRHGLPLTFTYNYDSTGNRTSEVTSTADKTLTSKKLYSYDQRGNKIAEAEYDHPDHLRAVSVYSYDDHGNKAEEFNYLPSGLKVQRWSYVYDSNGKIVKIRYSESGAAGEKYETHHEYDEKGRLVQQLYYGHDGSFAGNAIFEYDNHGNYISKMVYAANRSISSREASTYEYDAYGNWVKKTVKQWINKEGQLRAEKDFIRERTITYY
jgi:hypothetical protein